jgi:ATP-dependent exoDNAse (exonuclease V) alpha subunit
VVLQAAADAPLGTVARLAHGYRSPEPLVLVVGDEAAALYGERAAALARTVADTTEAAWAGRGATGRLAGIDPTTTAQEVRTAL